MQNFKAYLKESAERINEYIDKHLPPEGIDPLGQFNEAVRYSSLAGGKRIRPLLCLMVAEGFGFKGEAAIRSGAAIELIHTYSLIHDDLPSMDDDDYRRGKPTNHRVYGEATAILAGDSLVTRAFEWLAGLSGLGISAEATLKIIQIIAKASGSKGMIGGQVLDISYENTNIGLEYLERIHTLKTGALISAPIQVGAVLAGVNADDLERLLLFAQKLGLLFQVVDDILDIEGELASLGKRPGSDAKLGKATYPAILGLKESKQYAKQLFDEATEALKGLSVQIPGLFNITEYVYNRKS